MKFNFVSLMSVSMLTLALVSLNADAQTVPTDFSCVRSNPCLAPAECEDIFRSYVCHCPMGYKGDLCTERLLSTDDICLTKPCWNQGLCKSYNVSSGLQTYNCTCQVGTIGPTCRVYEDFGDFYVRVYNKGWYVASVTLSYTRKLSNNQQYTENRQIAALQAATFVLPSDTLSFTSRLTVDAVLGIRVMDIQLLGRNQCFDVWGTTLAPFWSYMPC